MRHARIHVFDYEIRQFNVFLVELSPPCYFFYLYTLTKMD